MSEIRSSLEIALEKTRNLKATDEEKRQWEDDRFTRETRALVESVRQPGAKAGEIRQRLARIPEPERGRLAETGFRLLIEEASLGDDVEVVVRALEVLGDKDPAAVREGLATLRRRLEDTRTERAVAVADQSRKELEARGIRGSAVVPNIETNDAWQEIARELDREWRQGVLVLA